MDNFLKTSGSKYRQAGDAPEGFRMNKKGVIVSVDEIDFSYIEEADLPSYSPRPPADAEELRDKSGGITL